MEHIFFPRSNYVLKYRCLMNFVNFRTSCQIAIRRPVLLMILKSTMTHRPAAHFEAGPRPRSSSRDPELISESLSVFEYMQNPGKPIEVREFDRCYRFFIQNIDFGSNFLLTLARVGKFDANLTRRI